MKEIAFEKVFDGLYLLKTPFSTVWTGVVLAAGKENFLIDSGAEEPETYILPALAGLGMDIGDIDYVLHTHCHGDHIAGHASLQQSYGLKIAAYEGAAPLLEDPAANAVRLRTRFPGHSPAPQSWLKGVKADCILKEGETLLDRFRPIAVPGHEADCVCWYDIPTGTILCGDSLQGNGTPAQGIGFYQNLADYRTSVQRLLSLVPGTAENQAAVSGGLPEKYKGIEIQNMILGHDYDGIGYMAEGSREVERALRKCLAYTELYETRIRELVRKSGSNTGQGDPRREDTVQDKARQSEKAAADIAAALIGELGCGMPDQLFLAMYTVTEHLKIILRGEKE